jgi:general secretion pathway protein C
MPRQIHIVFNLFSLFIITYILVDMFYNVASIQLYHLRAPTVVALKDVEMQGEKIFSTPGYESIVQRNIFGATEKVEPPPQTEKIEPVEMLQETSLQLSLLGTIAGNTESARAIILDERKRGQDIYKVGDTVQEAVIRQILRGKVVLRHGEKDEILSMVEGEEKPGSSVKEEQSGRRPIRRERNVVQDVPQDEAAGEIEVETVTIEQEVLQNSMSDLNSLMTQVRVRPYFRQGRPEGLIVSQIQPDSIFQKMGFMNGDIIASVNGKQMSTPEEAFQLYNSLQSGEEVSIEITRRGQKRMLTYQIN